VPKTRISSSLKLITFGAFVSAGLVACGDDPQPVTMFPQGQSGSGSSAGTPGAGGTFGSTAGTAPVGVSGTSFGTAGNATGGGGAGTAGAATGGTAGAGTAGAGTAGTGVVIPQDPFCKNQVLLPLPYEVTSGFKQSGWDAGAVAQFKSGADITPNPPANCTERVPGAIGDCSVWRYTPAATPSYAVVAWILQWDPGFTHAPVCLAEGATNLIFHAKGTKGGEKVAFGAPGVTEDVEMTLTPKWKRYEIPLNGDYNSFQSGVTKGFAIKVVPSDPAETVEFYVDNIMIVKDMPTDPVGGGEGGAGAGGADGQ
jgi:hypothetical protein